MSLRDTLRVGQTQNDFSVTVIDRDWSNDWINTVTAQTSKVELNLVKCELTLYVRQLKAGIIQEVIFHMLTKNGSSIDQIRVLPAKSKKHGAEYIFNDGKLVDHHLKMDYTSKEVIEHKLVFNFGHVNLFSHAVGHPITHYPVKNGVDVEL